MEEVHKEAHGKVEIILEAAQRRLGLYGYEKTTMKEIADDIAMSKASLYYYFQDKEGIFKAVIEREQELFFRQIEEQILVLRDPEEMLKAYIDLRLGYFKGFMNLSKFRSSEYEQVTPILKQIFENFRSRERQMLVKIIHSGVEKRIFHCTDEAGYADLFLDVIKGLRFSLIREKAYVQLSPRDLEVLETALVNFTDIFIRGLKYQGKDKG